MLVPPLRPALGGRRSVCRFAQLAARLGPNPRFRSENLIQLDLDLPSRTTHDYEPPQLAPQLVAALEAALQDEEDLELDGSYLRLGKAMRPGYVANNAMLMVLQAFSLVLDPTLNAVGV
ncbi:unnamed protein product [Protopolystoma xenopodis]|uniref:Uncharacterized protein n=1 Tax=Protopolystoma xenopodis TaxID=117903 RepID=A0A3S4ZYJ1_9PLAT|nr:unnamed protein product [Protopolystoma xenopodis]